MKSQKVKRSLKGIIFLQHLFSSFSRFLFLRLENQPFFSIFPGLISKPVYLSQFMVHLYHSIPRTKITMCVAVILCLHATCI